ncbi:MAG: ATP-binding cassette domain-containing protein, partial [Lachnospiraceae bacterium]|nr:ATP-binding cassette domain-containing protein [Lachnospiraceae bacterium]
MLTLNGITKKYKDKIALSDVYLELDCGIYGLLGPNGAGKSTLMNIITGNIKPTEGKVFWDGTDICRLGWEFRSLIGYAPQQQGLYNSFSGRRFLSYMAALKGISKKDAGDEIDRVLSYVNMQDAADRAIGGYSGGMKQRILIAQAILGCPKLIVLDEPTAGLDPKERVRVREQIKALSGDKIILVSTHVVSDIAPIAGEILLIRDGNIIDRGGVE